MVEYLRKNKYDYYKMLLNYVNLNSFSTILSLEITIWNKTMALV